MAFIINDKIEILRVCYVIFGAILGEILRGFADAFPEILLEETYNEFLGELFRKILEDASTKFLEESIGEFIERSSEKFTEKLRRNFSKIPGRIWGKYSEKSLEVFRKKCLDPCLNYFLENKTSLKIVERASGRILRE